MNNRRWAVAGLAAAAALSFMTAACGTATDNSPGTGSTSPTTAAANPKDALVASVKDLKTTTFKAKGQLSGGVTADAAVDPVAKAGTSKATLSIPGGPSITQEQIIVGSDSYVKLQLKNLPQASRLPAGWMKLDLSKLEERADYTLDDPDPARLESELFKGLSTVERTGDRGFKGTLDLTKGVKGGIVDDEVVAALKEKANAVPFEATVDEKGRIASFKIMVPAVGTNDPETWSVSYSDYGAPVSVTKPASSVPAPAAAYELLNS